MLETRTAVTLQGRGGLQMGMTNVLDIDVGAGDTGGYVTHPNIHSTPVHFLHVN